MSHFHTVNKGWSMQRLPASVRLLIVPVDRDQTVGEGCPGTFQHSSSEKLSGSDIKGASLTLRRTILVQDSFCGVLGSQLHTGQQSRTNSGSGLCV